MTIAACLIVKNEAKTIRRCLESVRDLVSCAVVIDTGSTDDTLAVLRGIDFMPVHVQERPWVDFAHNRNELFCFARPHADYLLLLDADQTVEGSLTSLLIAEAYSVRIKVGGTTFWNVKLVKSSAPLRYEGAVHEYLVCEQQRSTGLSWDLTIIEHADGGDRPTGTQPRWEQDVTVLEREVAANPDNSRHVFYLANTYEALASTRPSDPQACFWRRMAATRFYQRVEMGGYEDEILHSLYRMGVMQKNERGLQLLLQAAKQRPGWREPVYFACRYLNAQGRYQEAYELSREALSRNSVPGLFATEVDLQAEHDYARDRLPKILEILSASH